MTSKKSGNSQLKISAQEVADNLAHLANRTALAREVFGDVIFKQRFGVLEPDAGVYRYIEILPNKVVRYTTEKAIKHAFIACIAELPEDYFPYKIAADKVRAVVDYWQALPESQFREKIYPVLEKSQEGYCYHRLPFDACEMPTPLFDSFLAHVETNKFALQAFLGGLLDPNFRRQFYLWLWGSGGDGKGTLMRLLHRIFQNAYTVMSSSQKAQESQFFTSSLIGKRVAAFQDCHNPKLVRSEVFMQLTGGDALRIEPKGKDAYVTDIDALAIVSSNDQPNLTNSKAHIRRLIMCEMRQREVLDGDPQTYEDRLWGEVAGIMWKCKEAWKQMKEKHGGMIADQEAAQDVATASEGRFTYITNKYFDIQPGIRSTLKQHDMHGFIAEREHFSDMEYGAFKKYLLRIPGVSILQTGSGEARARVWIGLHFKKEFAQLSVTRPSL